MRSKLWKLFLSTFIFVACLCALPTGASAETDRVADGGYYTIKSEYCGLYLCATDDGGLGLCKKVGANALFEINVEQDGTYSIRALSSDKYIGIDELYCEPILTDEVDVRFDISYSSKRFTIAAPDRGACNALSIVGGSGEYGVGVSESSEHSLWSVVEYEPAGFTISTYTLSVRPYTTCTDLRAVVTDTSFAAYIKWSSSDRNVVIVDEGGRFCALSEGSSTLTASFGRFSYSCEVTVSSGITYAWFSQNNMTTGGWNGDALYNIYFKSSGTKKRYGANDSTKNTDWMSEGCAICSIAQVLRNMGARYTDGYDFRSGIDGNVLADPFMVSLANTANKGPTSGSATLKGDPVLLNTDRISSSFNVDGAQVTVELYGYVTKRIIKEALDRSPWGVVVCFKNSSFGMHYITFNKCLNPDAKNPNDYVFTVSDPASVNAENASDVIFEESYSYTKLGYRISHAIQMQVWSYEDQQ